MCIISMCIISMCINKYVYNKYVYNKYVYNTLVLIPAAVSGVQYACTSALQGLVFRRESHQLFSCSEDRTIKLWNLDEMSYVETL